MWLMSTRREYRRQLPRRSGGKFQRGGTFQGRPPMEQTPAYGKSSRPLLQLPPHPPAGLPQRSHIRIRPSPAVHQRIRTLPRTDRGGGNILAATTKGGGAVASKGGRLAGAKACRGQRKRKLSALEIAQGIRRFAAWKELGRKRRGWIRTATGRSRMIMSGPRTKTTTTTTSPFPNSVPDKI